MNLQGSEGNQITGLDVYTRHAGVAHECRDQDIFKPPIAGPG